jgi:hypothetical protein
MFAPRERQKRMLRVGAGDHRPRRDGLARRRLHPAGGPVPYEYARHVRTGSNFRAKGGRRAGQRLGEGAHAALHIAGAAPHPRGAAEQVMGHHIGGARRARTGVGPERGGVAEDRLHLVGFEAAVQDIRHAAVDEFPKEFRSACRHEPSGQVPGRRHRIGIQQRLDKVAYGIAVRHVAGQGIGVAGGEFRELGARPVAVLPQGEMPSVGEREHGNRVGHQQRIAMRRQIQIPDDFRPQIAQLRRAGRDPETRRARDLLRHAGAAHHRAAFQHQHAATGPRQIGGGDQAVMAAADDHGIVIRHILLPVIARPQSGTTGPVLSMRRAGRRVAPPRKLRVSCL